MHIAGIHVKLVPAAPNLKVGSGESDVKLVANNTSLVPATVKHIDLRSSDPVVASTQGNQTILHVPRRPHKLTISAQPSLASAVVGRWSPLQRGAATLRGEARLEINGSFLAYLNPSTDVEAI